MVNTLMGNCHSHTEWRCTFLVFSFKIAKYM